jgi:SAM-dependent methyltransferase
LQEPGLVRYGGIVNKCSVHMIPTTNSLERLLPDAVNEKDTTGRETLALHLERYEFAARHIPPEARVLDIACGVGYGTRLMAEKAPPSACFLGVDISKAAIAHAREHYGHHRIEYRVADAADFGDPKGFDVIVSLETIEHLQEPTAFLTSILRSLRPGGLLVGSVPVTPSVDVNPYHRTDFTARSFRRMLGSLGLTEEDMLLQRQPFDPIRIATRREARLSDMRCNLIRYYAVHPRAMLRRLFSTLVDGFQNKYLTLAARPHRETGH